MRTQSIREHRLEGDVIQLKCSKCGERKSIDCFFKKAGRQFGVASQCKECYKAYAKSNKERIASYQHLYRDAHKSENREYKKEYRKLNREKMLEHNKQFYLENRDKILYKTREYKSRCAKELGFSLACFHSITRWYVNRHNLRPSICPICGCNEKIETHHPSYENYNKWSSVVFCCKSCHKQIHSGLLECPTPINLLELN